MKDEGEAEPIIEIGPLCPLIKPWFFPADESLKLYELERENVVKDEGEAEPIIEIGPLCPPIKPWFFPADESLKPYELERENGEDERPSQPS